MELCTKIKVKSYCDAKKAPVLFVKIAKIKVNTINTQRHNSIYTSPSMAFRVSILDTIVYVDHNYTSSPLAITNFLSFDADFVICAYASFNRS